VTIFKKAYLLETTTERLRDPGPISVDDRTTPRPPVNFREHVGKRKCCYPAVSFSAGWK
jgi:hypothetical protein